MKSITSTIPVLEKRKRDKAAKNLGYINFDEDNLYPQRTENYIQSSGTATACVVLFSKFIRGEGFKDSNFYKSRVNAKGLTVDQFLRALTWDYARHKGFAYHVQYNMLAQPISVTPVKFKRIRIGDISQIEYNGRYIWSNCWEERKQTDIIIYEPFNLDKSVIYKQIEAAGGIKAYRGQIFYYSEEMECYPLSAIDAVLEDVVADSKTKTYRMNLTSRSFLADKGIEFPFEFESPDAREEMKKNLEQFQGTENAGKLMMLENPNPEFRIELHDFAMSNGDKMFTVTNETCKHSIIQQFNQPLSLLSTIMPSNFGQPQIVEGFNFYNKMTVDERLVFEEQFKKLFSAWYYPINPSGNYSIIPLQYESSTSSTTV